MHFKKIIILTACLMLTSTFAIAETVYLKDGKVIQGKIISKDNVSTVIQEGNFPNKYYNFQIDRIEQDLDPNAPEDLSKVTDKKELIRKLLEANGTKSNLEINFNVVLMQAQGEKKEKLRAMLNVDQVIELIVPVYDKHFEEEELRELVRFYRSQAGSKLLVEMPSIIKETAEVSIQYFKERENELN